MLATDFTVKISRLNLIQDQFKPRILIRFTGIMVHGLQHICYGVVKSPGVPLFGPCQGNGGP